SRSARVTPLLVRDRAWRGPLHPQASRKIRVGRANLCRPENLLQRRVRRWQHDGRVHLVEQRGALPEEFLPGRVLHGVRTRFGTGVETRICPDVTNLVWLAHFGLPETDDLGIFFARRKGRGERIEPLLRRPGGLGAIVAELVDISRRGRRDRRSDRIE